MKKLLFTLLVAWISVSCVSTQPLYNLTGYDKAVYRYLNKGDQKSTENLENTYTTLINSIEGERETPPPGLCADYGYLLIKRGEINKGKKMLNLEMQLYPESKTAINAILKQLAQ